MATDADTMLRVARAAANRVVTVYGLPAHYREDARGQAVLAMLEALPKRGAPTGTDEGFLYTCAVRRCRDWARCLRRRVRLEVPLEPGWDRGTTDPTPDELPADVLRALSRLCPSHRRAIERRFFRGESDREVAEATGRSREGVVNALKKAVRKLRRELGVIPPPPAPPAARPGRR